MIPFSNEAKRQEKYAREARQYEHDENLLDRNMPEHNEDEVQLDNQLRERADLIRWQQDLDDEGIKFMMEIRGYYLDEEGNWVRDKSVEPLGSEAFIRRIRPLLNPSISRNQIMTNYSEERILRSLKRAASEFTWILFTQGATLGVAPENFSMLVSSFKATIEPTYYRALNNGERRYLNTVNKRVETFSDRPEPKKKGIFGISG